ncbi:MAG: TolC family protein [Bryobacteraceae bacterium]
MKAKCAIPVFVSACLLFLDSAFGQTAGGPVTITLDDAIQMALKHNHSLLAARTMIQQNQAQEITASLRPNPTFFTDWEYLPLTHPSVGLGSYLHDSTEGDIGLSYLFERGGKRERRIQAARDATSVTRSQVADNERALTFQVATLFINVQLAQSTLELAQMDLKSFQGTVDISERQYKVGGIAENDYLKIKVQLVQFENDVQQALMAKAQALSDLRQLLGYESVPADYEVTGPFEYQPLILSIEELKAKAMQNRPDLRAAQQGIAAANSQYELAKANGKQDVTVSGNYSHVNGTNASTFLFSIPLPIFDRNQGEIARTRYAITQAQEQKVFTEGQALTDVKDAYEGFRTNDRIMQVYLHGTLEAATKSRDIEEYAYHRGAASLLDFLDSERTFRATQLAYRQTLAAYLEAIEQLREAVGTRSLIP